MKIVCTQENLKQGLTTVGRIISSANTLPILNNIFLKTENGILKISSTNLEIAITTQIRCKIEEEGAVTVVGKTLTDLVNNLPNQNISIQTQESELKIEAENYHTTIKTLPAEDFPLIPTVEKGLSLHLDSQDLKKSLDQVMFAVSTNQTQPEISGVLFAVDSDVIRFVATDRYRLAEKKLKTQTGVLTPQEFIVPQKTAVEISRIIGPQKTAVEIISTETQVLFSLAGTEVVSRLVDGLYPDYRQIIPTEYPCLAEIKKQIFTGGLKTTSVFSRSNNSVVVKLDSEKQQVVLTSESAELGKSLVEIPCKVSGPAASVVLNHHYIMDCLAAMETEEVVLQVINDSSASLLTPLGKDDYLYLVMPIKS